MAESTATEPQRAAAPHPPRVQAPATAVGPVVVSAVPGLSAADHARLLRRAEGGGAGQVRGLLASLQQQYGNRHVQRVVALARQGDGPQPVAPDVEAGIESARGSGRPLDHQTRGRMESAFGHDFGRVRVHAGAEADHLSRDLNAEAFTTGSDVFFREGKYDPGSSSGRELLAHELTHVVQQGGAVRTKLLVGPPGDRYEQEADQAARAVMRLELAGTSVQTAEIPASPTTQRLVNRQARVDAPPSREGPGTVRSPKARTRGGDAPHSPEVAAAPPAKGKKASPAPTKPEAKARPPAKPAASTKAGEHEAEPPARPDAGLLRVVGKVRATAAHNKVHPPAETKADEAQAAAKGPPDEVPAMAAARHVGHMNEQEPRPFDRKKFLEALLKKIEESTPKNLEEVDDFKESGKVGEVKEALTSKVTQSKGEAQKDVAAATAAPPDKKGITPKEVTDLKPPEAPPAPRDVGAAQALPPPKPEAAVSMQAGIAAVDAKVASAGVTREQLEKANEPSFSAAVEAGDEARAHAAAAPKAYRKEERAELDRAGAVNRGVAQKQLGQMVGGRGKSLGEVHAQQDESKTDEEQKRAKVTQPLQKIYDDTKTAVEARLKQLDVDVGKAFDEGADKSRQDFEDYVSRRMKAYKKDRYSGVIGKGYWVKDKFADLPDEVNEFYVEGKKQYVKDMTEVMGGIATIVEKGLTEAMTRIAQGKRDVDTFLNGLDESLLAVGRDAAKKIQSQFTQLEQSVEDKQGEIIDGLVQRYQEKAKALDERITELQEENKGLVSKVVDAVEAVLDTISKLKDMLLNVLAKVADAIDLIITDPIGFLGNLVAGVKQGFDNFVANIETHLKAGLLSWLFGELAGAGLQMPAEFDLAGILSIILQVLGLTYANIRRRAVKIVGEKVVTALETGAEIFMVLMTRGAAGLWEWIKDKATTFIDSLLEGIKSYLMERIIMAGVMWVISLLNPVSAFIKACKAIYDIVMFFVENGSKILALVNAVLDAIPPIAKGAIGEAANFIEGALAKAVPVVIGFLAALLGLGGISEKVKSLIERVQAPVNEVIDWVIEQAVSVVKAAGKLLGIGKEEEKEEKDEGPAEAFVFSEEFTTAAGEKHTVSNQEPGSSLLILASNEPGPADKKAPELADEKDTAMAALLSQIAKSYKQYQADADAAAAKVADLKAKARARRRVLLKYTHKTYLPLVRQLRRSGGKIGQPPHIWEVNPHSSQQSRLSKHPITIWQMESEHVIPRAVLADIADYLDAHGAKNIPSGEAVYNSMKTVMIYERAARIKTGADMVLINEFRALIKGLPGQKGPLTDKEAAYAVRTLIEILNRVPAQAVFQTVDASRQEQEEVDERETYKLSNKARRGQPGTTLDEPPIPRSAVVEALNHEVNVALDLIERLIQ